MTWTITRDATNPNDKTLALGKGDEIELTKENRDILVQMINGTTNSSAIKNGITILGIFPKFVKVSNNGKADVAYQLNQGSSQNIKILRIRTVLTKIFYEQHC